jgi:hypothetical protein
MSELTESMARARANLVKTDQQVDAWENQTALMKAESDRIDREIDNKIYNAISKEASIPVQMSWLPTDTARISFFAPVSKQDLKITFTNLTFKSKWGAVSVQGPALNITDEGVFLALLCLIKEKKEPRIKVNFKRICEILGLKYQTNNRRKIKDSIIKLSTVSLIFKMKKGQWSVKHILTDSSGDNEKAIIEIGKWFYSKYLINEITGIDMDFRKILTGDATKALYRFLSSNQGVQRYSVETLVEVLNMNKEQPVKYNRAVLKASFTQLQNKKFLTYKMDGDVFQNIRLK